MISLESLIEIFMSFQGAKITGSPLNGYTLEACGIKHVGPAQLAFETTLRDALRSFASRMEAQGDDC